MKAYWVVDNYVVENEVELIYLFCSVKLFKYYHPDIATVLYVDKANYPTYFTYNLWDQIHMYDFSTSIDKDTNKFWAAGKLQAMQEFETPFCILDLDMFYNGVINFEAENIFAFTEFGGQYYLEPDHKTFLEYDIKPFSKTKDAFNVSFFYISDETLKNEYTKTALEWMKKLSTHKEITGGHMVFCEQKLIHDLVDRDNRDYSVLVQDGFNCRQQRFLGSTGNYYHLGTKKKKLHNIKLFNLLKSGALNVLNSIDSSLVRECFKLKLENLSSNNSSRVD